MGSNKIFEKFPKLFQGDANLYMEGWRRWNLRNYLRVSDTMAFSEDDEAITGRLRGL